MFSTPIVGVFPHISAELLHKEPDLLRKKLSPLKSVHIEPD